MQREIKFRAWNKETDVMGKVGAIDWCPTGIISAHLCYKNGEVVKVYPHPKVGDDIIFMQYTGLKDKNGKEIYEGDIIKYISREDNINRFVCSDKNLLKADVIYQDFMFTTTGRFNFMVYANECEIIGNIYENKELLN